MSRRRILSFAAALASQLWVTGVSAQTPPPATPPAAEPAAPAAPAPAEPAPAAAPAPAPAPAPAAAPAAAAPAAEVTGEAAAGPAKGKEQTEEIVVTGTRVRRKDLTTPAPVTVVNKEQITASGKVSIGDFLQALPEQGNAINTAVNNGGDGATRVSLRSLGAARTLVLINGRRMVSGGTGADSSVDLNSIPTAAIERVEVLKDGASALYGSDAIGGVVNLITRKNWSGLDAQAYAGTSGHNDAGVLDFAVTGGHADDRGSILFSAGYFTQEKSMAGDRDFSKYQYFYDATGENNAAGIMGQYASGSSRTPGGRVSTSGSGNGAFNALKANNPGPYLIHDSSLTNADPGVAACLASGALNGAGQPVTLSDCQWRHMNTSNTAGLGGDLYNFAPYNYLVTPQQRIQLWASGDHKLGDVARGFFEASFVNRQSRQQLAPEPLIIGAGGVTDPGGNLVTISGDNIYNPFGKTITSASRRLDEFGYRTHKEDLYTLRVVAGFDGTLSDAFGPLQGWFWDTSFNYGRSYGTYTIGGSLQSSRVAAALGPSMLINGTPKCVSKAGDPSTAISGCVPLDLFHGSGTITQDQVAPLIFTGTSQGSNSMTAFQFNTSGELFKLASERPLGLAAGYEFREVGGVFTNDPITAHFDSSNGGSYDTSGQYHVNEGYAELSIPIVSNAFLAEDLEASLAGRIFDYSNFGSDSTYKVGGRWRPIRDVTFRGTYSTAFRAPSITDLYAGQYDNFPNVSDPCASGVKPGTPLAAQCGTAANNGDDSQQLRSKNGGNPDLKPETAKIYTIGVVLEPSFIKNLSVTLDYYNVDISHAITTVGEATILSSCYTSGQYCNLIQRDPLSHQINYIINLNQNVGGETSSGIDFSLRYQLPTPDFGRFGFSFDGAWLQKHNQTLADGTVIYGRNTFDLQTTAGQGATNPEWKFNAQLIWGLKGFGAGVSTKFLSGFHECGTSTGDFSGSGLCYVDSTFQRAVSYYNSYDMFLSYNFSSIAGKTNIVVGINNLFDTNPPKIYNTFASATDQYTYDQIGRFFYVRLGHSY